MRAPATARLRRRLPFALAVSAAACLALPAAPAVEPEQPSPPRLMIQAPPGYEQMVARVESFDRSRLVNVMRLVGLADAGRPIPVILAPEGTEEARAHPPWIAGYTVGGIGPVVLFPSRALTYPHDSLEAVLHHEVAHVLIARAARGRPIPRWFNEGVAMAAERTWDLGDETRLWFDLLWRDPVPLDELDALFRAGAAGNRRAYALSGALVHDLIERAGPTAPARILALVAANRPFEAAFTRVTGESPPQAATGLWSRRSAWLRWTAFLTSSMALWMAITALALLAIRRHRARRREMRQRWEEEERGWPDGL